ncbi:MAG: hypothetical protein XD82_0274 [Methanoculleus marisnigri]|uniref:Uncharacterized protein n=1 Tax=Methanoculleus marisnigri TaxID=2198 RepID=A0A117LRH5_9EURY|nr:MAG: hypothetical protein XD82_0274 [Methanoculleus marisnigri]
MTNEKEGDYCTVCGGIRPDAIKIKTVLVDGKETGINQLEMIVAGVRDLHLTDDAAIRAELLSSPGLTVRCRQRKYSTTQLPKKG